jgi:hypothetical protein
VPQPVIDAFSVNPPQIQVNQCVNIAWSTSGGTQSVKLLRNGAEIDSGLGLSGSVQDCLSQPGQVTYTLVAANRQGTSVQQQAGTNVVAAQPTDTPVPPPTDTPLPPPTDTPVPPPTDTPVPPPTDTPVPPPTDTPVPQPPTIISFTANPPQLDALNNCTVLEWQISGQGIVAVFLFRNGQQIAGPDVASGYQDCVAVSEQGNPQVYELRVDSEFAGSTSQQLTVPFGFG